jgi:hypothetical protein
MADSTPTPSALLPNPPFLVIPGVPNIRDIGGYPTPHLPGHPDRLTRPGIVFRSAAPSIFSGRALSALSIGHVFDLRSHTEIVRAPGPEDHEGLTNHKVPVFPDKDYSPEAVALRFQSYAHESAAEGFGRAYGEILSAGAARAFAPVLAHLALPETTPLLVHCTAGKDRTGIICALVLSLCGVSDEVIAWEYSLTELGLADKIPDFLSTLSQYPAFRDDPEGARRMLSAKPEAILAALHTVREQYGSVEDYVRKECGLSEQDVIQLRENMTVEASAVSKGARPSVPV